MKIPYPIRINKYLASLDYDTRKGADVLIEKGLVFINGRKAVLGDKVNENDKVTVNTKKSTKEYRYFAYNKDVGISTNPELNSKDILKVTKFPTKVFPVGRLDKNSHGLIIMTNDGRITDKLLSPEYVHDKEYIVKIDKPFSDKFISLMQGGIRFDGFLSKKCKLERVNSDTFKIILTEGKKRQIRRMCEVLHHEVIDLKRIRIMNINLGEIKEGQFREIKDEELKEFLKLLGITN